VKFLAPDPKYIEPDNFEDVAERFRREGVRGASLRHENLVTIHAYVENTSGSAFDGQAIRNPFLVMELVNGRTLESLIRNMGRDDRQHVDRQSLSIALRVCQALQHLHERKIVHRDVKPGNIFVSTTVPGAVPTEVKLGDFGITKWGDYRASLTTGTLTVTSHHGLGTLKYMSPEQAVKPKDVTVRSDMYSLGITLFELFTGTILPTAHHVFEIRTARNLRTSIAGRLHVLGVQATASWEEGVFEPILDMFLGADRRPTSKAMAGRFEFLLERFDSGAL
jgi:serine/threonine protein kinase